MSLKTKTNTSRSFIKRQLMSFQLNHDNTSRLFTILSLLQNLNTSENILIFLNNKRNHNLLNTHSIPLWWKPFNLSILTNFIIYFNFNVSSESTKMRAKKHLKTKSITIVYFIYLIKLDWFFFNSLNNQIFFTRKLSNF